MTKFLDGKGGTYEVEGLLVDVDAVGVVDVEALATFLPLLEEPFLDVVTLIADSVTLLAWRR